MRLYGRGRTPFTTLMSKRPALSIISFGSQRKDTLQKSQALLKERFGIVEWLESSDAQPTGEWIWCIPERCELPLGALLRVEGIMEEGASGIHFFHVQDDLWAQAPTYAGLDSIRQTVSRFSFLHAASILMRRSTWKALFVDRGIFEIAEMGLAGIEDAIHSFGIPYDLHPERLHSEASPLRLDWKRIYGRSRSWLKPFEPATTWKRKAIAVVCLVRTPGLSDVKPELAEEVSKDFAEAFYRASLEAVEGLLEQTKQDEPVVAYWAIEEPHALQHPLWSGLRCVKQGDRSLPENIGRLYAELLKKHRAVFFLGSDCPQMSVSHMKSGLKALNQSGFILGPTADKHWYLWGGNVSLPEHFWDCPPKKEGAFWADFTENLAGFAPVGQLETLSLIRRTRDLDKFTYQTKESKEYSTRQFDALKKLALLGLQATH